jgi:linoleoyl-CoA desaturase
MSSTVARPKFPGSRDFYAELRRRVHAHLKEGGYRERDIPGMYAKTGVLFLAFAASWVALMFFAHTFWLSIPLALLLGLTTAAIGFNVQHDGGHHGYSNRPWVNRLMARSMDLIGASSYIWHWKHGVLHHTYTNIDGHDDDIALGPLSRMAPQQARRPWHRFQHIYLWGLYSFLALKWHLVDDFYVLARGRMGEHKIPRPRGTEMAVFWVGKLAFFTWTLIIPLMFHSWPMVFLHGAIASLALGFVLSVVFQLAHIVEEAEFPDAELTEGQENRCWARHQVETTVDFAQNSKVLTFLFGGLNFQVEHHLFPKVCHLNYPRIAPVVAEVCAEFGVKYRSHPTIGSSLGSHYRWLRRMGRPDIATA